MRQDRITGIIAGIASLVGMYIGYNENEISKFSKTEKYEINCPVAIGSENITRPFRGFEDRILNTKGGNEVTLRTVYNAAFDPNKDLEGNFPEIEGLLQENEDIITPDGNHFKYVNTHDCIRYELQK